MFVRTKRLTLRPGWREDAPALAAAFADRRIIRNLARAPWPYAPADAEAFLARPARAGEPDFLIFAHESGALPLVGGIGVSRDEAGERELGYWLAPDRWGRGYMTEAVRGVLAGLRHSMGLHSLVSGHFVDNPASGRVLEKAGFRPTGAVVPRWSEGRGAEAACRLYRWQAEHGAPGGDTRLAA